MNWIDLEHAGEELRLSGARAAYWRRNRALLVADVHFGKASAFRHAGIPVPEDVTVTDLRRLSRLLADTRAERLVILGDLFHAKSGRSPATMNAFAEWRADHQQLGIDLLTGNHDRAVGPLPDDWRIRCILQLDEPPFTFSHHPGGRQGGFRLCGHVHPAIHCAGLRLSCFHFNSVEAVFPSFGSFTGSKMISPQKGDRIFAVHEDEILEIPSAVLRC